MKKLLIIPMLFACYMGMCQASVIGKPIRLQKFEIAQYDFPNIMNWKDAKAECAKLGKGWRLPTKDELNIMYENKDKIGGFAYSYYWSSTVFNNNFAWLQSFINGKQDFDSYYAKDSKCDVRAVRAF